MRFIRALIGWLSFLCLLVSAYIMLYEYPRSFARYELPPVNSKEMMRTIQELQAEWPQNWVKESNFALRKYVQEHSKASRDENSNLSILPWSETNALPKIKHLPNKSAAALLDGKGRVIAAYPTELIGFEFPNPPANDPNRNEPSSWGWDDNFRDVVGKYTSSGDGLKLGAIPVKNKNIVLGYLATVYSEDEYIRAGRFSWEQYLLAAYTSFAAFWLLLAIWTTLDANWRGMRPVAWGALVLLTNIIGLCAYLFARLGPPGPCPNCGEKVLGKYKRCPACGISLLKRCPACRAKLKPGWQYCPICNWVASPQSSKAAETIWVPPPVTETAIDIAPTEDEPISSLTINVFDSDSGIPISEASIVIAGPNTLEGTTRQDGSFEAKRLLSGHYTITASKQGYNYADMELDLDERASEIVQFELKLLSGEISGRVCDQDTKQMIAGAQVYIDSSRVDRSATTGNEGSFLLSSIPAGPYTICAEAEGFISKSKLVEVSPNKTAPVDFSLEHIQQAGELSEQQ